MELLSIGPLITMTQNVVYALPRRRCKLYTNTAGATFQQSNDSTFASSTAVTLVEGGYEVSATFIRSTAGDALVSLTKF